jgi:GNAT superfamily N-acetyltransferase
VTILTPRELHLFPIDALLRLSVAAGWNQTEADWRRMLRLSPGLCWGIEVDGQLAASATGFAIQEDLAWIGMVLTLPEFRGRGLAGQLVGLLIEELRARGYQRIGLDATAMGAPLYRKFGFREQGQLERWVRSGETMVTPPSDPLPATANEFCRALALDGSFFGAAQSVCFLRLGAQANYLGPFEASHIAAAQSMLARLPLHWSLAWDLFPDHPYASQLAQSIGLQPSRSLLRMGLGPSLDPLDQSCLGIAGFEYGVGSQLLQKDPLG